MISNKVNEIPPILVPWTAKKKCEIKNQELPLKRILSHKIPQGIQVSPIPKK